MAEFIIYATKSDADAIFGEPAESPKQAWFQIGRAPKLKYP